MRTATRKQKRLTPRQVSAFRRRVYAHYRRHARPFPWRTTRDPYRILVSEVMLQQTQAARVVLFYRAFLRRFLTVRSLSRASRADVLRAWQGLGYNRRALALHNAAREIVRRHRGQVPSSLTELITLPGIGPYTAAAVRAFAFNQPGIVLETNIRTVFIHEFFPRKKAVHDRDLLPLIEATLDRRTPRRWYSALMDYGAAIKTAHGNAARRSASYKRQAPFTGSNRALRGRIIKLLLEKPRTLAQLTHELKKSAIQMKPVIYVLYKEGFLKKHGTRLSIAS